MRRCIGLLASALVCLAAPAAEANGRFPAAQRLLRNPENPAQLYLSATFGLLVSGDAGKNWYYVCERAFASAVVEGDALLEVLPNGTLLSGIVQSLRASADCGCSWQSIAAEPDPETVVDITKTSDSALLALVRTSAFGMSSSFRLDASQDGGGSWTKRSDLPGDVAEAITVDAAPSNPSRVYVSALTRMGVGVLLGSDDGGATWQSRPIEGASASRQPYIAAVHPTNADAVFVRTDTWEENDEGQEQASDALLYTADAGGGWRSLLQKSGKLFGFALAEDGATVFAGYGDPVQAVRVTVAADLGIYRARVDEFAFEQLVSAPVSCLSLHAGRLDACFEQNHPELAADFTLGSIAASELAPGTQLTAFTPVLRLEDVRGPLDCVAAVCGEDWSTGNELAPAACARLKADCSMDTAGHDVACRAPGGAAGTAGAGPGLGGGAGTVSSGGAAGAAARAGASPGGAAGTGAAGGAAAMGAEKENSSGCGCSAPRGPVGTWAAVAALLSIFALRRREKRVS